MLHYVAAGLTIASDVAFPGLVEARAVEAADIRVFATDVPDFLSDGEQRGPLMWTAPGRILIDIPDVVRLLMIDGRELRYRPAADNAPTDVAIFLNATGLGALFHQREMTVLHASAVLIGDRAVLFCGKSGAGKSTLAAALNQRGYPLIADEICAISKGTDGRPEATPDGRCLKLWQDAFFSSGDRGRVARRTQPGTGGANCAGSRGDDDPPGLFARLTRQAIVRWFTMARRS